MPDVLISSIVGATTVADGTPQRARLRKNRQNAAVTADGASRYYESNVRGQMFSLSSAGAGQAQVGANLFSTAIASFQPIVGIWNPSTSTKNAAITHAWIAVSNTANNATATGSFMWVVSAQQTALAPTLTVPISCSTLQQNPGVSAVRGIVNAALTGATGSLLALRPLTGGMVPAQGATFTIIPLVMFMEEVAGSIIVPPGGFCGIANGITGTTSTLSGGMTWEEIPI